MGPRSADRGNVACASRHGRLTRLQWGRDQLIAEIRRGARAAARNLPASMGPRSADRGNDWRHCTDCTASVLQWGRDQLIAEMLRRSSDGPCNSLQLQWGRDQLIAEIAATPTILLSMICDTVSESPCLAFLPLTCNRITAYITVVKSARCN